MNPITGEIREFKSELEAREAGFSLPIKNKDYEVLSYLPEADLLRFAKLPRSQRRDYVRRLRNKVSQFKKDKKAKALTAAPE